MCRLLRKGSSRCLGQKVNQGSPSQSYEKFSIQSTTNVTGLTEMKREGGSLGAIKVTVITVTFKSGEFWVPARRQRGLQRVSSKMGNIRRKRSVRLSEIIQTLSILEVGI